MPTDEMKQRIAEIKRRAADAVHGEFCGVINECQAPVIVDIATRHFIAEIERLQTALEDANGLCRSAMAIAKRRGLRTNWTAFEDQLEGSLIRQREVMYSNND